MTLSGKLWITVPDGVARSLPPGRYMAKASDICLNRDGEVSALLRLKSLNWRLATLTLKREPNLHGGEWLAFIGGDQWPVEVSVRK